jgi:hypothetical protein
MELQGQIMECKFCMQTISTSEMINAALGLWNVFAKSTAKNAGCSIQKEWLDIAAYRYPYDFGGAILPDPGGIESASGSELHVADQAQSWINNKTARLVLLHFRFDEHEWMHRNTCFKNGHECRAQFPMMACDKTHIYESTEHELVG